MYLEKQLISLLAYTQLWKDQFKVTHVDREIEQSYLTKKGKKLWLIIKLNK